MARTVIAHRMFAAHGTGLRPVLLRNQTDRYMLRNRTEPIYAQEPDGTGIHSGNGQE